MVLTAVVSAALAACGGNSNGEDKTSSGGAAPQADVPALKIGLLAPVTGPTSAEGKALSQGAELAIDEINASGGVLGKHIEVVRGDDQSTPSVATTIARKMLQRDHVDVLFGTITGDVSTAVGRMADQAKTPFFQAILGGLDLCSPYVFKIGETPYQLLAPLIPYMIKKYGPRVALVGSDYEFPHRYSEVAKGLIEKAGGTLTTEEYSPLGTSDWSSVIDKLKSSQPDFVLSSVVGGDAIGLLKAADSLGLLDSATITGVSLLQEYYPATSDIVNGRDFTLRYSDQLVNPESKKFAEAFRAKYNFDGPIAGVSANAYVGIKMLATAVEQAKSTDPEDIAKMMPGVSETSMLSPEPISFDKDNHYLTTPIYLSTIKPGGKYTVVKDEGVIQDPTKCG